jgi:hypothetical protein
MSGLAFRAFRTMARVWPQDGREASLAEHLNAAPTQKPAACQNCGATTGEACNLIGCFGLENPAPVEQSEIGVPEGYALVPVEPTPEMCEAYQDASSWTAPLGASAYKAMIAAAPTPEPASPWISVEDRLPEYEQNVLVEFVTIHGTPNHTTAELHSIARHVGPGAPYDNRWFVTVASGHELHTVTRWMPLPAAPEQPAKEVL